MDRKQFINNSGRWILLAILGLLSGFLIYTRKVGKASACQTSPVCRNCNKFSNCNLPQADEQRKDGE